MAEQPLYFIGDNAPSSDEIETAKILYSKRVGVSRWHKLDFASEDAQAYRTACAIVADRSGDLERLLQAQLEAQVGTAAPPTPLRDVVRKLLLGESAADSVDIWTRTLLFYPHRHLVEFRFTTPTGKFPLRFVCVDRAYWDVTPVIAIPLTTSSLPIHEINAFLSRNAASSTSIDVSATDGSVEEYIKFFCAHVASDDGYFQLVEGREDFLPYSDAGLPEAEAIYATGGEVVFTWLDDTAHDQEQQVERVTLEQVMPRVIPLTRMKREAGLFFAGALIYADVFFNAVFQVLANGMVEMVEDFPGFDGRALPLMAVRDPRRAQATLKSATGFSG